MRETIELYDSRKAEVIFYYQVLAKFDLNIPPNLTTDNARLFKIMKSNFLLMLYNLIEACIVSGMMEIYASIAAETCHYQTIIGEIKKIWINQEISKVYSSSTGRNAYIRSVTDMITWVIDERPIVLTKEYIGSNWGGNLDAKKITELCDKHRIRYVAKDKDGSLLKIRHKRNALSHGDVSFSECARDITVTDLYEIMNGTFCFLYGILTGMKTYYDGKEYLVTE